MARFWPHFWKSLAPIRLGNALFFLLLSRRLPASAQRVPGRLELGLIIDLWACVARFGMLELLIT